MLRKNDNALNSQAQVPQKGSVDSVIANAKTGLKKKNENPVSRQIAHLNINSIRNKFNSLSFMIENWWFISIKSI